MGARLSVRNEGKARNGYRHVSPNQRVKGLDTKQKPKTAWKIDPTPPGRSAASPAVEEPGLAGESPPLDPLLEDTQPIDVFQLPDSFDYDALVTQAEREHEESEESIAEDLGTWVHTVRGSGPDDLPNQTQASTTGEEIPASNNTSYHHRKRTETRKAKRKADKEQRPEDYTPSSRAIQEALRPAKVIRVNQDAGNFDAAKGAHTAKKGTAKTYGTRAEMEREWTLEELVALGYIHIPWDGIRPLLVVDCKGRVVAFFAGRPNRPGYVEDMTKVFNAMMEASESMNWLEDLTEAHKRGFFQAYNCGVTMGMGSPTPVALQNGKSVQPVLERLLSMPELKRLNGFQNGCIKLWEPQLHRKYYETVDSMHRKLLKLPRNFEHSIFTASAFNFGGRVRTIAHRDHMNWPFGLCVITALGHFDATKSAHLVLKEFKIVINFPHALSAAIPSACATHFNTRIAPGDTRTSFTQYTAGAIFRWVENGFRTEKSIKETNKAEWKEVQSRKRLAVSERLKLYTNVDDLLVPVPDL
ncbi:hypothetical protein PM082_003747 [Marasmius tenuissimus]|nr:hypothetical protein PM082_003747 [Marasmius tenuissimus]